MRLPTLSLLLMAAVCFAGCRAGQDPDTTNVVAVDRSGSTKDLRKDFQGLLVGAFGKALDAGQSFSVWAVDRKAECLFERKAAQVDRLPEYVFKQLAKNSTLKGTRPAEFWEEMAARYVTSKAVVRIAYLTDGGNDFTADAKRIEKAVATLTQNPKVFVSIVGVNPDQRRWLESTFAPLGERILVSGRGEEGPAVEQWFEQGKALDRKK